MAEPFRVAIASDFKKPDGSPVYPDFDLIPLRTAPGVEANFIESGNPVAGDLLEDYDALILLTQRFGPESIPKDDHMCGHSRVRYDCRPGIPLRPFEA